MSCGEICSACGIFQLFDECLVCKGRLKGRKRRGLLRLKGRKGHAPKRRQTGLLEWPLARGVIRRCLLLRNIGCATHLTLYLPSENAVVPQTWREHTGSSYHLSWYIRRAFKGLDNPDRVEDRLDYSLAELRAHIEPKLNDGMTWGDYLNGDVVIDHIIPRCRFNERTEEGFRACWALSNLQPMWAPDNIKKGATITQGRHIESPSIVPAQQVDPVGATGAGG